MRHCYQKRAAHHPSSPHPQPSFDPSVLQATQLSQLTVNRRALHPASLQQHRPPSSSQYSRRACNSRSYLRGYALIPNQVGVGGQLPCHASTNCTAIANDACIQRQLENHPKLRSRTDESPRLRPSPAPTSATQRRAERNLGRGEPPTEPDIKPVPLRDHQSHQGTRSKGVCLRRGEASAYYRSKEQSAT